uniref:Uncharacterized protein n=1 Tax=Rhizophora mucronata TaxID=61149 RepID=A0A2P2K6L7_RHIMU
MCKSIPGLAKFDRENTTIIERQSGMHFNKFPLDVH